MTACIDRQTAIAARDTMVVDQCDDRTLIVCFDERDLTIEVDGEPVKVECEDSNVVDVDFGDDDRRWRAAAWIGERVSPTSSRAPSPPLARLADPSAPRPPAPRPKPAPSSARPQPRPRRIPEPDYSNYTGPRCYAPGGKSR